MTTRLLRTSGLALIALAATVSLASAQTTTARQTAPRTAPTAAKNEPPAALAPVAPNYIIGPDDVLTVTVWNQKDVSGDVIVRPDGKITLPVGNDIVASGLTTEELKVKVAAELDKFYEKPQVFIQVKQINSRRVYITGAVNKPGVYPLTGPMNVVQLISMAGGLQEFADRKNIMFISATAKDPKTGQPLAYRINYDDLMKGKNVAKNNIELRPGDQVIVK